MCIGNSGFCHGKAGYTYACVTLAPGVALAHIWSVDLEELLCLLTTLFLSSFFLDRGESGQLSDPVSMMTDILHRRVSPIHAFELLRSSTHFFARKQ